MRKKKILLKLLALPYSPRWHSVWLLACTAISYYPDYTQSLSTNTRQIISLTSQITPTDKTHIYSASYVTCCTTWHGPVEQQNSWPQRQVFGSLVLWAFGSLGLWFSGPLGLWFFGPLGLWFSGSLCLWFFGSLGLWFSGHLGLRFCGSLGL